MSTKSFSETRSSAMMSNGEADLTTLADFSAFDAVVDATHRYSEIFYEKDQ